MTVYFNELCRAMEILAADPRTIFIGQAVSYPGTAMYRTLLQVPEKRRIELPVAEEMQLGLCIGMSLNGFIPVCIYPRWNFLLLAMNQLVNHLDKLPIYSDYRPKVIIRVGIGSKEPLDPGPQHLGDFSKPIDQMLQNVRIMRTSPYAGAGFDGTHWNPIRAYKEALESDQSSIVVEDLGSY